MASKVGVPKDEETVEKPADKKAGDGKKKEAKPPKKKKKRSKCCTCCLIFLIVMLVFFGVAFGIGWYFGDKYTKQYLGMSLGDVLGTVGDLYWADDDDVVSNPYNNRDLDGFYSELKRNLLLKDDAEVDFDKALEDAVNKFLNDGANSSGGAQSKPLGSDGTTDGAGEGESGSDVMDILVNMITDVFTRENIDIERLDRYDEFDPSTDEYIFDLKDKQIAAFLNAVLRHVFNNKDKIEALSSVSDIVDVSSCVSLKQVIFRGQKITVDEQEKTVSVADVTLWLGLQKAANGAIKHFLKEAGIGWLGGFAGWFGDVLLPENIYITVTVPLTAEGEADFLINDMDAKELARAKKLINNVLKLVSDGEPMTIEGKIAEYTDLIKPYLEKANEFVPLDEVKNGAVTTDLLAIVVDVANDSLGEGGEKPADPLKKADFLYLLQVLLSDPEARLAQIQPFRYTDRYIDPQGKEVYIPGGTSEAGYTLIDYEREFIREIENKYSLTFKDGAKLVDILKLLGVSLDGKPAEGEGASKEALLDLIDGDKFNALLDKDIAELELNVTDRMLAAALGGQMNTLLADVEELKGMTVALDALTFSKKADRPNRLYATLVVEVDPTEMLASLESNELVGKLAAQLIPDKILLTVTVDITRSLAEGETRDATSIMINAATNTDRAVSALEKLVPDLEFATIADNVSKMLNDMLDELYSTLNIRLVANSYSYSEESGKWSGESGELVMPDIFTVVTDLALLDEDGRRVVEPDELKDVLRALNDDSVDGVSKITAADSYSGFIADVVDKYYLDPKDASGDPVTLDTFDALTAHMSEFDTGMFRIAGSDPTVKYLAHDTRSVLELRPLMTARQLGDLISKEISGEEAGDYTVIDVKTYASEKLDLTLAIGLGALMPEDVKFLISANYVNITAKVDLNTVTTDAASGKKGYGIEVTVNSMDGDTYAALLRIIRKFGDFDIDSQIKGFGETLYEQMTSLENSLSVKSDLPGGSSADAGDGAEQKLFRFTDDGLELMDFYTFLSTKMKVATTATPALLKETLQGMYSLSSAAALDNPYNYDRGEVLFNLPGAGDTMTDADINGLIAPEPTPVPDKKFNTYVKQQVEGGTPDGSGSSVKPFGDAVEVKQTSVLAAGDRSVSDVREWLSSRIRTEVAGSDGESVTYTGELSDDKDYVAVTFSMDMGSFKDSGNESAAGFYPDGGIYVTVVFEIGEDTVNADAAKFYNVGMVFNGMDKKHYDVLLKLMHMSDDSDDPNKVNITTVSKKAEDELNKLTVKTVSAGGSTITAKVDIRCAPAANRTEGLGKISFKLTGVSA